jgi:hypothetical protein
MGTVLDGIDADPRNGGDKSLPKLEEDGLLPQVWMTALTPSGGLHHYIKALGERKYALEYCGYPGIDYQAAIEEGDGSRDGQGLLFLPPTVGRSKVDGELRAYSWLKGTEVPSRNNYLWIVDDSGEPLRKHISKHRTKKGGKGNPPGRLEELDGIGVGSRHPTLMSIAGSLRYVGMDEEAIYEHLQLVNQRVCKPPKPDAELADMASYVAARPPSDYTALGEDMAELSRLAEGLASSRNRGTGEPDLNEDDQFFDACLEKPEYKKLFIRERFLSLARGKLREDSTDLAESWGEVDLDELLGNGAVDPVLPDRLQRKDGTSLAYAGAVHWLWGKPGHGKTFAGLLWAAQEMKRGRHVVWMDLEQQARSHMERLLLVFRCPAETIRTFFHLIQPSDPFGPAAREKLAALLEEHKPSLVVLDAANDFVSLQGGKHNDVDPINRPDQQLIQPCVKAGSTMLVLDHMPKDSQAHGWPVNSGAKKAITTVGIELEAVVPFSREQPGYSKLTCYKDRLGTWADGQIIGYLCTFDGDMWLSDLPPMTAMSAEAASSRDPDARKRQQAMRRLLILTCIGGNPGEYTKTQAAETLARDNHAEGEDDGYSASAFARQINDMLNCAGAEIELRDGEKPDRGRPAQVLWPVGA